jgi:hypothetical protein
VPRRLDGRDPDIVKAYQLARNPSWQGPAEGGPGAGHRDLPALARETHIGPSGWSSGLTTKEDAVHPVILQELATQQVKDMIAQADTARARRTRQARTSDPLARPAQPSRPPGARTPHTRRRRQHLDPRQEGGQPALMNSCYRCPRANDRAAKPQASATAALLAYRRRKIR